MARSLLIVGAALLAMSGQAFAQGDIRITTNTNLNTLDPNKATIGEEYVPAAWMFSGLVRMREDGVLEPELAEKWDSSGDVKTWTFPLKQGVKFHDGREMTAEDVVFSFRRIMDKDTGSPVRSYLDMVETVEALDKYTVRFALKISFSAFAHLLAERQMKVVPREHVGTLSEKPVGTGPFRFKSYTPGDRLLLERNPTYFESGQPKFDSVTLRIMPEAASRIAALEAGEIDIVWNVPLEVIGKLKQNPSITVDEVVTASWDGIVMNTKLKPFDDARVRKAVYLALDKSVLAQFAVFGHGSATHTPIPSSDPFFNKNIPFKTDIAEAKRLLAEAGYPNGFDIPLYVTPARPTRERLGVAAQQMLKQVGINANVQRVPYNRYEAEISGKVQFYTDGFFARSTIDTATYPLFHSNGTWNNRMWSHHSAAIDKLLEDARATKDPAELKRIYDALQQRVVDENPGIIAYTVNWVNAYTKKLKGFSTNPYGLLNLRAAYLEK